MGSASLRPVTILLQICTVRCTKLRKHFAKKTLQIWKCFTDSPLRSACLAMHQTTTRTIGLQLQRAFKARWLSSEAEVRVRSEILAIWAALKQLSEDKNDAVVLLRLMKTKKFNMLLSFCQHLAPHLTELRKAFQTRYFDFAQMKACVELTINKLSDAAAESEIKKDNCEKFDSELWELKTPDGCVSSGMAFWKGNKNRQIDHLHTEKGRQE